MFIALKIINVLRLALNILTGFIFVDYFEMQGSPTADETPVFAGLLLVLVPTIFLWVVELIILSRFRHQKKNYYLSVLSNSHFICLFFLGYAVAGLLQFLDFTLTGTGLMILNFAFFMLATIANIYMLFHIKLTTLELHKKQVSF
jgi:hypothetical protein